MGAQGKMSERKLEPTPGWCDRAYKHILEWRSYAFKRDWRHDVHELDEVVREYESAEPATPEPLPHEFVRRDLRDAVRCVHCKRAPTDTNQEEPCPARNKPEAEKREELPELSSETMCQIAMIATCWDTYTMAARQGELKRLCRYLLAEAGRIAREEIDALHKSSWAVENVKRMTQLAKVAAREELAAATVEVERVTPGNWVPHPQLRITPQGGE